MAQKRPKPQPNKRLRMDPEPLWGRPCSGFCVGSSPRLPLQRELSAKPTEGAARSPLPAETITPNSGIADPHRQDPPLQPALAKGGWRHSRRGDSGGQPSRRTHPPRWSPPRHPQSPFGAGCAPVVQSSYSPLPWSVLVSLPTCGSLTPSALCPLGTRFPPVPTEEGALWGWLLPGGVCLTQVGCGALLRVVLNCGGSLFRGSWLPFRAD